MDNKNKDSGISDKSKENMGFADITFAKLDTDRKKRRGFSEAVYCKGKSVEHIVKIAEYYINSSENNIIFTRVEKEIADAIDTVTKNYLYTESGKILVLKPETDCKEKIGKVTIVTAGTSDIPVAIEAETVLKAGNVLVKTVYDVGVAGIQRLFDKLESINDADVIIVIAGMEGALVSVLAGLTDKPVIAVPTSVGYGASFEGIAPLLTMLNSCAEGVGVVNIDNGFGAARLAQTIIRRIYNSEGKE